MLKCGVCAVRIFEESAVCSPSALLFSLFPVVGEAADKVATHDKRKIRLDGERETYICICRYVYVLHTL